MEDEAKDGTQFYVFPTLKIFWKGYNWNFGILEIMLYWDMRRGKVCSMERGSFKCSVIVEFIVIADSEMTEIFPESAKYAEKADCSFYTKQAPGDGTKRFWKPAMRYLESGSKESALRRCNARVLRYLGAHYIIGTCLWFR